jgi:hypothetical protein
MLLSSCQRLLHGHDPQLLAIGIDDPDRTDPDLPVDPDPLLVRYGPASLSGDNKTDP